MGNISEKTIQKFRELLKEFIAETPEIKETSELVKWLDKKEDGKRT